MWNAASLVVAQDNNKPEQRLRRLGYGQFLRKTEGLFLLNLEAILNLKNAKTLSARIS